MAVMKSAIQWKQFYAREREAMGAADVNALFDRAPHVELTERGAIVFPHTKLGDSGHLIAAAARAAVASGRDTILALGVLHGGRERDADLARAARAGDQRAIGQLRGVHGRGAPRDGGIWTEEFSLDNFTALVPTAAKILGVPEPRVIQRYPFLVGSNPHDLPGLDELRSILEAGAALVATTDPVHHGVGYGTPPEQCLQRTDPQSTATARRWITEAFGQLSRHDFGRFLDGANRDRSDFRDVGPAIAALLGREFASEIIDLTLVDYAGVLGSDQPTWVVAALARLTPPG
jgi:hypothetical protein